MTKLLKRQESLQQAKDMVAYYEKNVDDLIKQYGTGVRPSWVSTDLAIVEDRIEYWKAQVKEFEQCE